MLTKIIIGVLIFVGFIYGVSKFEDWNRPHRERSECVTWKQEAERYPLWKKAQWQKDQCAKYDIFF